MRRVSREELRNQARRIAKAGYFCLLPDLYYRLGTIRFDMPRRNDAMSVVIRGAMKSLTNAALMDDTAGMLAFLDAQDQVKPGPMGCVGHCMSGPFALVAAARFPRMKAAASLYGVDMVTDKPDSPHLLVDRVKGELYIGFAEIDPAVPGERRARSEGRARRRRARGTCWRRSPARITATASPRAPTTTRWPRRRRGTKLFALWERNLK